LARHLLRTTTLPILATTRTDPPSLRHHLLAGLITPSDDPSCRLEVVTLDVTSEPSIVAASYRAASIFPPQTHHLHLGFCLPGILHAEKNLSQVDYSDALETYKVNTLGVLMVMKHFERFLPKKVTDMDLPGNVPGHAVWVNMGARVGSVSDNRLGGWYSYRSSKAAVHSLTKSFDWGLRTRSGDKAVAMSYHPGTVKTHLTKEFWGSVKDDTLLEPEAAVEKMAKVVMGVGLEQRGLCWDWKGEEVPP
ncbi:hypothetical protein OQA88_6628, partial [Cercophora sp. LCS_1]